MTTKLKIDAKIITNVKTGLHTLPTPHMLPHHPPFPCPKAITASFSLVTTNFPRELFYPEDVTDEFKRL